MKFKNLFRTVLSVLVIVSMLASIPVFAQEPEGGQQYTITEPYEYPVVPGTPEWEAFTDHQQMLDACQVPVAILHKMTTEALIETIMNYPLISDIYAYDEISKGRDEIESRFNGFEELKTRNDAAEILLNQYENMPVPNSRQRSLSVEDVFKLSYYELLLAQDDFGSSLSEQEHILLENLVSKKQQEKSDDPSLYGITKDSYYRAISEQDGTAPMAVDRYIKTKGSATVRVIEFTDEEAQLSADDALYLRDTQDLVYPNADRWGAMTGKYNCHSYAWYKQSTSNPYWMPDASPYMASNGGYSRIYPNLNNMPKLGDRVYYASSNNYHSAYYIRTTSLPPTEVGVDLTDFQVVRSKWAKGRLYEHKVNYCPYYTSSSALRYYR